MDGKALLLVYNPVGLNPDYLYDNPIANVDEHSVIAKADIGLHSLILRYLVHR